MPIELVVFDLAGTTVKDNQDVHRVLKMSLAADGVAISLEDANEVMGIPKPVAIRALLEKRYSGNRAITEEWISDIHHRFVNEMIHFYQTDPDVGAKQGVNETFRRLKAENLKVVVDTGFDRKITDSILKRMGWKEQNLIDGSVTSDEVERGRPFPDLIFKAMELTHITDPKNVAKVGDTVSDIEEGKAAGCGWVVGVTTGAFSKEALDEAKPTHLIEQVDELFGIFKI